MIKEFEKKLDKNEYISTYLYQQVLNEDPHIIPEDFDLDLYNNEILNKMYFDEKEYFDNMYKGIDNNIHLDEEQCKAILADEKYSLIIAGAGTGKTTTMVSKVKYLVDKKNVDPGRILVLSYTRKATEEIAKRIEDFFGLPVFVCTFHSLGYEYIKQIFHDKKCAILDRNIIKQINIGYFSKLFENKKSMEEIIKYFTPENTGEKFLFSKYFLDNYKKYDTYDDFFKSYITYKKMEAKQFGVENVVNGWIYDQLQKEDGLISIKGEKVKSAGEFTIANFLFSNGLDYNYEEIYEELMDRRTIYKPDFTVDYGGKKIYIEYFGMDDEKYNRLREKKRAFHKKNGNNYIEINRQSLSGIRNTLDSELQKYGIKYKKQSPEYIYENILRLNPVAPIFPFLDFLRKCVITRKESKYRDNFNLAKDYTMENSSKDKEYIKVQYKYILSYDKYYNDFTLGNSIYYFDFADLLYYSAKYIDKLSSDNILKFDYIIIDEYQDISDIKYELTRKTQVRNDAKVYAVGDDWQCIYSFSGSQIKYIYNFKKYFEGSKILNINKTYRNSQELINYTGEFIMKNPDQIKKQLISDKHNKNPIIIKKYESTGERDAEMICLKNTILDIHKYNPKHNILILARTNKILDDLLLCPFFEKGIGSKIILKGHKDINIDCMTMHKSKGLTYDQVIIIGLDKNFPIDDRNEHWYISLYKNNPIVEKILYPEERRLFYVAMTRAKNKVFLLKDSNNKNVSKFLFEIMHIIYND